MHDHLIQLRTAYLRLVAEVWADENLVDPKTLEAKLVDFGAPGPEHWDGVEYKLDIGKGPKFGDVASGVPGTWTQGLVSSLTIFLPLTAAERLGLDKSEADKARALADYYMCAPHPLTSSGDAAKVRGIRGAGGLPAGPMGEADLLLQPPLGEGSQSGNYASGLGDWATFIEFGGMTMRIVGLAWSNPAFKKDLLDPEKDTEQVLLSWLGFNNPWNMKVIIQDAKNATWRKEDKKKPWTLIEKSIITLHVPSRPEPGTSWAVALASYNNTGPQHPLSCCV